MICVINAGNVHVKASPPGSFALLLDHSFFLNRRLFYLVIKPIFPAINILLRTPVISEKTNCTQ